MEVVINEQDSFAGCAHTVADGTQAIDKIHLFIKINVTLEPIMRFLHLLEFRISLPCPNYVVLGSI